MSQAEPRASHQCSDCRVWSPETETEHTLISAQHGWRLTRRTANDGAMLLEWRCPSCWVKYKQRRDFALTPLDGVPSSSSRGITVPDSAPPSGPRSRR